METIRCERCNEVLKPEMVIWLELSITDGKYYANFPEGHITQGGFSFGQTCAGKQLKEDHV
jgi:hypothetical protein